MFGYYNFLCIIKDYFFINLILVLFVRSIFLENVIQISSPSHLFTRRARWFKTQSRKAYEMSTSNSYGQKKDRWQTFSIKIIPLTKLKVIVSFPCSWDWTEEENRQEPGFWSAEFCPPMRSTSVTPWIYSELLKSKIKRINIKSSVSSHNELLERLP